MKTENISTPDYQQFENAELLKLYHAGNLSTQASSVVLGILTSRGVTQADIQASTASNKKELKTPFENCEFVWWMVWAVYGFYLSGLPIVALLTDSLGILAALLTVNTALMVMTIRYNKYAFIALTALSLNPFFWIVNGLYLYNRWNHPVLNKKVQYVDPMAPSFHESHGKSQHPLFA